VSARAERRGSAVVFQCPGCRCLHSVIVERNRPEHPLWTWNGSLDRPTFSPSILVRDGRGGVCHSFVTDGRIQLLGDCTNSLAGQTVDLPEVES
jgi:hypothetical protein